MTSSYMRMSRLYAPTLREDPQDADIASHRLLLRAGCIRKTASGLYSYLPLAWRSLLKIEQIVREEMDAIDAQELMLPILTPAEFWLLQAAARDALPDSGQVPRRGTPALWPAARP